MIKKVYEADPLVCPRCSGPLKIISLIDDGAAIEKILRHLKLWDPPERPPPPEIECLLTENRVLREKAGKKRLRVACPLCQPCIPNHYL